jgi:hypothetical protein
MLDVDAISAQARAHQVSPGRALATMFAGILFALGWLAASAWLAVGWSAAAVRLGWQERHAAQAPGRKGR